MEPLTLAGGFTLAASRPDATLHSRPERFEEDGETAPATNRTTRHSSTLSAAGVHGRNSNPSMGGSHYVEYAAF